MNKVVWTKERPRDNGKFWLAEFAERDVESESGEGEWQVMFGFFGPEHESEEARSKVQDLFTEMRYSTKPM